MQTLRTPAFREDGLNVNDVCTPYPGGISACQET